jgi:23S rRNA (guanosine2251-2'-O)-methyltransferase
VLDGVTDPHNLGACLRWRTDCERTWCIARRTTPVSSAIVSKIHHSGAAETMPYLMVTNLARTLEELRSATSRCIGTSNDASKGVYDVDLKEARWP